MKRPFGPRYLLLAVVLSVGALFALRSTALWAIRWALRNPTAAPSIPAAFAALVGAAAVLLTAAACGWFALRPLLRLSAELLALKSRHRDADCPPVAWRGDGEPAAAVEVVNRMLETLKARAAAVANMEARHLALLDGLPDALAIFDPLGRLVAVTKQLETGGELLGLVPGEPLSASVFGLSSVERFMGALDAAFRHSKPGRVRMRLEPAKAGAAVRHLEFRVTRMDEYFALVIIRDVSVEAQEHKLRMEAESRALEASKRESLAQLAAGIAHDMNNVLSVVLATAEAEIVRHSTFTDPEASASIETVRTVVRKGSSMMRELMAFAGEAKFAFSPVSPAFILKDIQPLGERLVGPDVVFSCRCAEGAPQVDADPNQFWKVLFNIVKNAAEALGDRPGHIKLTAEPFELTESRSPEFVSEGALRLGPGVLFRVEDDGPGISPEVIGRIFDPYVSSKSAGRGLGLALVRSIVEAHGGGVSVASRPDEGTVFSVFLPASRTPPTGTVARVSPEPQRGAAGGAPGDVLVVDNDEMILKTTSLLLKSMKIHPLVARGRADSLEIVRHDRNLRAILLDANITGVDTVRLYRMFRGSAPNVPVIVSSGAREEQVRELFGDVGLPAFLPKPYTRDELQKAITSCGVANLDLV